MVKNNKKSGFTLAEVLISLAILTIFFAASARIFTQRPKQIIAHNPHGFYECYYNNSSLYSYYEYGEFPQAPTPQTGDYCEFIPPTNAGFYNITLIGLVGSKLKIHHELINNINQPIKIKPSAQQFYNEATNSYYAINNFDDETAYQTYMKYLRSSYPTSKIALNAENNGYNEIGTNNDRAVFISW